ncbi:MAG TPA: hypothetical protein VGO93_14730 [Candidatus Xenobia bacterium]
MDALPSLIQEGNWALVAALVLRGAHATTVPLGEDEKARRHALNSVLAEQCRRGNFDAALSLAEATADYHRIDCLLAIAQAEMAAGRQVAVERLLHLPVESGKELTRAAQAVVEVAVGVAGRGDAAGAAQLLERAVREGWSNAPRELAPHALAAVAIGYGRLGRFDEACNLMNGFGTLSDETFYELALEQIRQGRGEAGEMIGRIQNPSRQRQARMEVALRTNDLAGARELAREAETARARESRLAQAYPELDTLLARLCREYLEAGRPQDARVCVADIQRPQLKAREMAQVQVEEGKLEDALAATAGMDGTAARDYALLAAVEHHAARGEVQAAVGLVGDINKIETRDRARRLLVEAQCRQGDFEGAFTTFNDIQNDRHMAAPMGALLAALVRSGRTRAALRLALQLPRSLLVALEPLTRVLLEADDRPALEQVLPRCAEAPAAAWRFVSVVASVKPDLAGALAQVMTAV